ncbi:MAG: hypothetical protein IJ741_06545 [Schwartzia sp.]|nr:hypothetical protein [Schwartzia sp. (in: firmicutes)]MBR1760824.1 hypothetical protein [Schwartzia sp. (in: firmicutes)]
MKKKMAACLTGLMMMSGATALAAVPSSEIALGGVAPGMDIDEAIAAFGTPTYRDKGAEAHFSNGVKIDLDEYERATIEEIKLSRKTGVATPAGITIGSPESAIKEAYGEPDKLEYDGGKNKYTYYASDSGMKLKIEAAHGAIIKIKCELDD